jgi:PDDEXK-like domain of unknown function (DUF3799)
MTAAAILGVGLGLITAPGIYPDITPAQYFAEPCPVAALTNSGVQMLSPIGAAPAKFAYNHPALNPDGEAAKSTAQQYLGSVVHRLALGKGADYEISPYDKYQSKEAKAWRDDVEARGVIPIKQAAFDEAEAMAEIVRAKIEKACQGEPYFTEVVIAWIENIDGVDVWCRAMVDVWCPSLLLALDVKTTADCDDEFLIRRFTGGYAIQDAWYRRGLGRVTQQEGRIRFGFLFVETEAPFLDRNVVATEGFRFGGAAHCNRALEIFAKCMKAGKWPGYQDFKAVPPPWWVGRIDSLTMMEEIYNG